MHFTVVACLLLSSVANSNVLSNFAASYSDLENLNFESALRILQPRNLLESFSNSSLASSQEECSAQMKKYYWGVIRRKKWALKMVDSSSKLQSGLLTGNLMDLGMYDECVAAQDNVTEIRGHQCIYTLSKLNASTEAIAFSFGSTVCLPATCDSDWVARIVNETLRKSTTSYWTGIVAGPVLCSKVDTSNWTAAEIATIIGFSSIALFLVACTICEFVLKGNRTARMLAEFSLRKNALRLLSMKASSQHLPGIHGIRFLSIFWVAMGHQYVASLLRPFVNTVDILEWSRSWKSLHVYVAPFAVDTFFTLSGFLMSYHMLKEMDRGRKFNVFKYYIHRYVRLTPAIIALLLFTIFIFPHLGSGPLWEYTNETLFTPCRTKWWTILLYINNYYDSANYCLGHTWYLAVDMQLFLISPIILYPLAKWPKIGLSILGLFFLGSIVTSAAIFAINKYQVNFFIPILTFDKMVNEFRYYYSLTHLRAAPWLVGIFLGYEMATKDRLLDKVYVRLGWFLTTVVLAFCIFGYRTFQSEDYEYNVVWETIYNTASRPLWGAAICWVIFSCARGYAGPVGTILSLPIFQPLGRLSYCIYLLHIMLQFMKSGIARTTAYFTNVNILNLFLGDLVLITNIAFIFSLFFESPILILEKMILKRKSDSTHVHESKRDLAPVAVDEMDEHKDPPTKDEV